MINFRYHLCSLHLLACAVFVTNVYASELSSEGFVEPVPIERDGFIEPVPIKRAPPIFPQSELYKGNSGMVEINMMINKKGNVFEPLVVRSTSKRFEVVALNAAKKYLFQPATYNGKPVSSQTSIVISFRIDGEAEGVSKSFASKYKKISKELNRAEPDFEKLDDLIDQLSSVRRMNHYAHARYSLVKLRRAMLTADLEQQIEATRMLLLFDQKMSEQGRMLDAETFANIRQSLFFLLIQTQRYADALDLYFDIEKSDPSLASKLTNTVKKIEALRDTDKPSVTRINLIERAYQLERLFKKSIMLIDTEGEVTSLNFRCDRGFTEMAFKADTEYKIPSSWGECLLEIVGKAGASANLVQY